ncbi:MAG TPA: permease-like cell division protein FtsX [Bacteroidota bacterium]|nr:permease-like cell division protein FtsX [Bacteroidota bacterium]
MNFFYILKEGISGFTRARLSMVISIFTITISLILLGLFTIVFRNTNQIVESFRDRVEMEAFLEEPVTPETAPLIEKKILAIPGIKQVRYISKDEAAKIFKDQYGEDIHNILDFNPLPPSFKIYLDQEYKNSDSAKVVYAMLKQVGGVDDVIYRKTLLELLDRRAQLFAMGSLAAGIALLITAVFLVSNTIRLAIYAKRKIIVTMKLVGATRMFIRLPFLVEGIIQGILGGAFSSIFIYFVVDYASKLFGGDLAPIVYVEPVFYLIVIVAGTLLGFFGSIISVRKFITESVVLAA